MRCSDHAATSLDSLAGGDVALALGLVANIGGLAVAGVGSVLAELDLLLDGSRGLVVVLLVLEHWGLRLVDVRSEISSKEIDLLKASSSRVRLEVSG